ncbi:TonB-dependent siderophore receptor [Halarcobacter mediterraneus]|uniref:TonB-dependent siderophore receptor n=1 Tax=Halarcobacter mediterraneus TaxID=2023153 RepID=A0A4Q1AWN9_9BACT|nr:TonB-dependent siderophore receptor [Halarcobacter mediterraneus]RXK13248.1 TonB-dependent siderophore receptor [Halarcobacter mediterraneus]
MKYKKILKISIFTALALQMQVLADEVKKDLVKDSKSLGTVEVVSSNNSEDTNSYTIDSMNTSTKLSLSVRDTPQSVKVLTNEYIEDLGVSSYQDLLNNVTGVTLNRWDERLYPTARGFDIDYYQLDGIPTYSISSSDPDLSIYDRVEIVKGANGLMTGAGNPALSLNFIRKHANSKELKGDINLSVGSWENYSSTVDISGPLNSDGSIRGRLVAKHEDKNSYMDFYEKTTDVLYGVVDMDLTDTTYLSIGASYEKLDRSGIRWGGLPAFYSDGTRTDFDRSKTVTSDWTYWNQKTKSIYLDLKQYVYNDISLNLNYTRRQIYDDTALLYFGGTVDKDTNLGVGYTPLAYSNDSYNKENNIDIYTSIPFDFNKLGHEIIAGFSYNKYQTVSNYSGYPSTGVSTLDFNNINISAPSMDYSYPTTPDDTIQTGTYLVGKFSLMEQLKLIAGVRLTNWKYENDEGNGNREFKNEVTPYVGLIYDLNENHSIYASYTDIFKPQNNKDENGDYLDPKSGESYETGIKGEYFDNKLNAALSLFRIEQDNVAEKIDGVFVPGTTDSAYKAVKGVVSKGFEIELDGEITDNWNLNFGIAYFKAENANGEKVSTDSSQTTANLFTKYTINDFSIGGGVNYKSKYYTGTGATQVTQDSFFLANAMASYKVNKNIKLQLNVNNIFDKKYYSGIGANSMVYGDPRNATLTLKYTF